MFEVIKDFALVMLGALPKNLFLLLALLNN